MPEETHQPQGNRGRNRRERVEIARSRDILDVANELNMELVRDGKDYRWKEHDSLVISPDKNKWNWFSRHQGGDVIALVETIREINFNQAIDYLNDGTFKEFTAVEREKEPFRYHLQPYEQDFVEARNYLKVNRGLSDETIDFFLEKGVLAQANAMLNNSVEPVVVFKTLASSGEITGASLQGIVENRDKWPGRGYAKNIIRNSDGMDGLHVDIGKPNRLIFAESPIDLMSYYEINEDTLKNVRLISMDGLKEATIGRHLAQLQSELSGRPLNWTPEQLSKGLQTAIESQYFADGKHSDMITLAVDNDTAGRTFIEELKAKGAAVTVDLPELRSGQDKADWNDTLQYQYGEEATTSIEKSPEHYQETDRLSEHQKNERTNGSQGSLQPKAEGSPTPAPEVGTFERSVTSRPTLSSHLLYFTINEEFQSSNDGRYHAVTPSDLAKLNRTIRRQTIQNAAQYYLDELANSKIYYVTPDKTVQVHFEEQHFMHLTGIKPIAEGQTPEKTLHDFAEGNGHFDNIFLANNDAAFDKLNVLSDLSVATESTSFYFDDLTDIRRYNGRFDSLIKSDDKDIILLFKELEDENFIPISVFQSRTKLTRELEEVDKTPILGVYRERDGQLEQLSINENFVSDGGEEMLDSLKNQLTPPDILDQENNLSPSPAEKMIEAVVFTQVLDSAYNVGNPIELGVTIPEEFQEPWARYTELLEASSGDFNAVVVKAEELGLLDKTSSFYQDWHQDQIYHNNYHVRLQWSEEWPNSPRLPFEEQSIVSYEDFVKELYRVNQGLYQTHHESIEQTIAGNSEAYLPFTKIKFDIYAPGGQIVKEGVRYDIGEETEPVSRLLGLGYRRLEGQAELAAIDENVLSQLENQALNQEISQEANNPQNSLATPETDLTASPAEEKEFRSPKQETKGQLEQRVNEIVADNQKAAEEVAPAKESPGEIDYSLVSPHELSEIAFQKIREFTRSPEALAEYMDFMSKFPQLSPRNVALIQDQWQGANAVATYNQWQALGKTLGIKPEDVIETRNTYTNKRTGETKEVVHQGLSVKSGEKAQITLFRPLMAKMIPVLDDQGNQVKNSKGNPKFKKISEATTQEKALLKEGKLKVVQFQERDQETGLPKFTTYKVFELSQTTLKPESYPKAMPNRQYQFDTDQVKTKEVLDGLCDYAGTLGVRLLRDEVHELGNAKGAFYPGEQKILLNPNNLPGEQIATTIHELAHATLHNPKFTAHYKEDVSTPRKELEAEMTSHLVSKHFGLDTSEAAIDYMAGWTKNLTQLDDKQLAESMKRIHQTVSKMVKHIEHHTKPYEPPKNRGQSPNFPKSPTKGLKP